MQVKRSLSKVASSFLILLAAITAAYGSQPPLDGSVIADTKGQVINSSLKRMETIVMPRSGEVRNEKASILKLNKVKNDEPASQPGSQASVSKVKKTGSKKYAAKKQTAVAGSRNFGQVTYRKSTVTKSTVTKSQIKVLTREQKIALEQKKAEEILAAYIAKYPILKGVKIYVRDCPNNWQGCAYYTKGIILIDPDHTAPLERIIEHEVKHILDWRTDGDIDYNDYHK